MVALREGRTEAALEMTERAIEHAEATGNDAALTSAYVTRARAQTQLDRIPEAQDSYARAADLARNGGPKARLREVLGEWADLLARTGEHERAYALTREALSAG